MGAVQELDINFPLSIRRVNQDMRDEWFPDPLQYDDFLELKKTQDYFSTGEAWGGQVAEPFNLPKSGFTLRYSLETFVYDKVLYQGIVDTLAEIYDPLLNIRVYSHRLKAGQTKYIFHNGVEAWKRFVSDIRSELKGTNKVLLVTDIQNYFEFISIDDLKIALHRLKPSDKINPHIDTLTKLLHKWSPNYHIGIPQNQDPSSFLGNVYLHQIDEVMANHKGYNYFRYMDDIRIVCDDEFQARKALKDLVIELRYLRLNVNAKKTKIICPDENDRDYIELIPSPNRVIEEIDSLFNQRRASSIRRALPKLKEYTHKLIEEGKTTEREFRFCINRLEKVARCDALEFDYEGIIDHVIDLLPRQPWSTDSVVRMLRSVELTEEQVNKLIIFIGDPKINIYEWQGYLLWQLISIISKSKNIKSKELKKIASDTLTQGWDIPMKAGAVLYLGACGDQVDRLQILKNFNNCNSRLFLRSVLISTHETPKQDAVRYLFPYISDTERKSYEYLRSSQCESRYFEPLPKLMASELFDDLPGIYAV